MIRIHNSDLEIKKIISRNKYSITYLTNDNKVYKSFTSIIKKMCEQTNKSLEKRITESETLFGIVTPSAVTYLDNNKFDGYLMDYIDGIDMDEYERKMTLEDRIDLYKYAKLYLKLEKIIKTHQNVVFPDLLNNGNIIIKKNGIIKLIDYDGMQIKDDIPIMRSSAVESLKNKKYFNDNLYTKQLDIRNLIIFYFLHTFNIDLSIIDTIESSEDKKTLLNNALSSIGLEDIKIIKKIKKIFTEEENEYLGEDVKTIAQQYRLDILAKIQSETPIYIKKLRKK